MPLTDEQRAAIRRRIQQPFVGMKLLHEGETTSSIEPPEYDPDDFEPSRKRVDHLDPPAIDAPESDPEPTLTHGDPSVNAAVEPEQMQMDSPQESQQEQEPAKESEPIANMGFNKAGRWPNTGRSRKSARSDRAFEKRRSGQ